MSVMLAHTKDFEGGEFTTLEVSRAIPLHPTAPHAHPGAQKPRPFRKRHRCRLLPPLPAY